MPIYRPRMRALVEIPVGDTTEQVWLYPTSATLESNSHLHADELEFAAPWADVAVDPRYVKNAAVGFWLDQFDRGSPEARTSAPRFLGMCTNVERKGSASGLTMHFKAQDYTCLFIECKPIPTAGIPHITDTLADAWRKICDHCGFFSVSSKKIESRVGILRNRLVARGGVSLDATIAQVASTRFARFGGRVAVKEKSSAWDVWQHVVGMMGLLSYIDGDQCIVTTTTDEFRSEADAPVMVWGRNILDFTEGAASKAHAKGVGVSSFDPLTGTTLEAFYRPDRADQVTPVVAFTKKGKSKPIKSEDYELFVYQGVTDVNALHAIARMIYEQRSRQEMTGSLTTAEMAVDSQRGGSIDLVGLRSGSTITVAIEREFLDGAFARLSDGEKITYLVTRGQAPKAAALLVKLTRLMPYKPQFKVRKVRTSLSTTGDSGSFRVAIDFWNRIDDPGGPA